jgi:hypothetical protein
MILIASALRVHDLGLRRKRLRTRIDNSSGSIYDSILATSQINIAYWGDYFPTCLND